MLNEGVLKLFMEGKEDFCVIRVFVSSKKKPSI